MYNDLSENDILKSVDSLLSETNLGGTQYALWYDGKLISPWKVLNRAYELNKKTIGIASFDTIQANNRLLDFGFPIVDSTRKDNFFTLIDLHSFKKIIERKKYDSNSVIDQNIGAYLNKVSWEKTRIWNEKLKQLGWIVKGYKHWNKQNGRAGQGLKDYTWYRVYPQQRKNDLLCFTIGIHADESLVYKLDCTWSDPFFTQEKKKYFQNRSKQLKLDWQFVYKDDLINYTWERLIKETNDYFLSQLDNFHILSKEFFPEKRLFRLTWNEKKWELPSGHKWKKENQGNTNIAHENQYGYGHEEWLFNVRYRIEEYQYGYIRGVQKMSDTEELIDKAVLYTIDADSKQRYLVAEINNVEIIEGYEKQLKNARPIFEKYDNTTIEELKEVWADYRRLRVDPIRPNVKFKWMDATIYNDPIPVSFLSDARFNRFQPYKIEDDLEALLNLESQKENKLNFNAGKASTTSSYSKTVSGGEKNVNRNHSNITDDLYEYLHKIDGYSKDDLSAEKTRVGGAIIDFAVKETNGYRLFEAKSSSTAQQNIRQAIGQLLEYAFKDEKAIIKELIIVGPAQLKIQEKAYFDRLKKVLNVAISYWAYVPNENNLKNKFIKQ